jgi:hypothetical protein
VSARQELEELGFTLHEGCPIRLRHYAGMGVYLEVLALRFENHTASFEVLVELLSVHRTNASLGCTVAAFSGGGKRRFFSRCIVGPRKIV